MIISARMFTPYVPRIIISQLATYGGALDRPRADTYEAVVFFVDISGFTSLAERMAREGPRGAELLSQALNASFQIIVDTILHYGGDVVKFAGDALLAFWPTDDLVTSAQLAARAALMIQETL